MIIGGRLVGSEDKILSLCNASLHEIVRGKAGAEVKFGNTLFIADQAKGLVVDWKLHPEMAPAECRQLASSMDAERGEGWLRGPCVGGLRSMPRQCGNPGTARGQRINQPALSPQSGRPWAAGTRKALWRSAARVL